MSRATDDPPLRLIDLAVEWPLQYAGESTAIDADAYPGVRDRLGQVEGYLSSAIAAIAWFGPAPGGRPDPWGEVARRFAGIEAEFPGRVLADPADLGRFDAEPPDALTWVIPGLRGASELFRAPEAGERLAALVDRGLRAVRLAGLVDRPPMPGIDRGLAEEERSALAGIVAACSSRTLLLDLAGLPPVAAGEAIAALGGGPGPGRVVPIVSLGASADGLIAGLRPDDLGRLRSLGGLVGLCPGLAFHADAEAFGRALDGAGGPVALGTGFLGIDAALEGLGDAPDLLAWLAGRFDRETAARIASGHARTLLDLVAGPAAPADGSGPDAGALGEGGS